ncbi:MAG: hypothetical protein Q7S89_01055 [bacterium]|nr:hypothetical protein [bacterium]
MKRSILAILAVLTMTTEAEALQRPTGHLRLYLHGKRPVPDTDWGVGGWTIYLDAPNASEGWQAFVGPRYQTPELEPRGHGRRDHHR